MRSSSTSSARRDKQEERRSRSSRKRSRSRSREELTRKVVKRQHTEEPDRQRLKSEVKAKDRNLELTDELPTLPFVHHYRSGKLFYVRECYKIYYKLVKAMLDDQERCITVTGTPGIGKSVFYAYCFQRLREDQPDTWIITAAYHRNRLILTTVFKGSDEGKRLRPTEDVLLDVFEEASTKKKSVIYLCDGPPPSVQGMCQMVVFTDPNEEWFRQVRKDGLTLFMPLWTYKELEQAALALAIAGSSQISGDALKTRFDTFGGVARECLSPFEDFVDYAKSDRIDELKQITSLDELRNLFNVDPNRSTCQRVLHCFPIDAKGMKKDTKLASPFVVESLAKRMLESSKNDMEKLRTLLKGFPQGAPLLKWLSEFDVANPHEGAKL